MDYSKLAKIADSAKEVKDSKTSLDEQKKDKFEKELKRVYGAEKVELRGEDKTFPGCYEWDVYNPKRWSSRRPRVCGILVNHRGGMSDNIVVSAYADEVNGISDSKKRKSIKDGSIKSLRKRFLTLADAKSDPEYKELEEKYNALANSKERAEFICDLREQYKDKDIDDADEVPEGVSDFIFAHSGTTVGTDVIEDLGSFEFDELTEEKAEELQDMLDPRWWEGEIGDDWGIYWVPCYKISLPENVELQFHRIDYEPYDEVEITILKDGNEVTSVSNEITMSAIAHALREVYPDAPFIKDWFDEEE